MCCSWADPPSRHSISAARHGFYGGESFRRFGFAVSFLRLHVASKVKKVVYWMSQILFAAEIAFRGLDRCMPQQKLNLLQFTTAVVTQFRAGPPLMPHAA